MEVSTDGLVSRYVNRRVSRPISKWLANTPVSPNQVSVVSFAIALASLWLFVSDNNIWAGIAVQSSSIMDGVDGELARLKGMATRFGGFFDAVLDRYADVAILGGLAYGALVFDHQAPALFLAAVSLLAMAGTFMVSYTRARAEASLGGGFRGLPGSLASRDARLLLISVGAVLGQALTTLILLACFTNAVVIWRVALARARS